jgi:hypothetical protein
MRMGHRFRLSRISRVHERVSHLHCFSNTRFTGRFESSESCTIARAVSIISIAESLEFRCMVVKKVGRLVGENSFTPGSRSCDLEYGKAVQEVMEAIVCVSR